MVEAVAGFSPEGCVSAAELLFNVSDFWANDEEGIRGKQEKRHIPSF